MILEILIPFLILIVLLLVGVPIAFTLAAAGAVGLYMTAGADIIQVIMTDVAYNTTSRYLWTTLPMFILMAEFLNKSDLTSVVFEAAHRWMSGVKGGLAMATTLANGGMAALSGSSTATAAAMSSIAVPEMKKYNYDDRLSLGTVAAAGTFAITIPPSLGLIVYGVLTQTSIGELFLAGIIPGLLSIVGYVFVIYLWGSINKDVIGGEAPNYSWGEKFSSLKPVWPAILIVLLVLGGIYLGVVTPTEAGALGASGTFVVGVFNGGMRFQGTKEALVRTAELTAMIFLIVIGALVFGRYLAFSGAVNELVGIVEALPLDNWMIMMLILVMYLLLGTVMDQLAILILTLPITFPLAVTLGYDPILFGILIAKTIEIGLVTPPLGLNVYIATGAVNMDAMTGFKGAMRFIPVDLAIIVLLLIFPEIVTSVPDYMA